MSNGAMLFTFTSFVDSGQEYQHLFPGLLRLRNRHVVHVLKTAGLEHSGFLTDSKEDDLF